MDQEQREAIFGHPQVIASVLSDRKTFGMLLSGAKFEAPGVAIGRFVKFNAGNPDADYNAIRYEDGHRFKFEPLESVVETEAPTILKEA